ncbi:CheR-type MCP methyltransferase [Pandoraea terrae]|uniref:CheR-type MCP methyltransferase n=1 Tax=Pandoraea terrae TaxID=1537710 RepID=A0A5E4TEW4_9BURK|nr:protein-glutamate O-methyltransferase CheR [Pandoraea terrae]VVD86051.1 CheR-type MCP methyltransferase [Pandoraea terrae]
MSSVERIEALLQSTMGLDAETIGGGAVERAVRTRLAQRGHADLDAYWLALQQSPDELQALIEAVVVPETWFFRHRDAFTTLGRLAHAAVAELEGCRPLRLLSLPCSTGEEPYSIAMALFDAGLSAAQFEVDAVDISVRSLEVAQNAVFGRNSFRGMRDTLSYRERYFSPADDGHHLTPAVRARVRFSQGNLFDDALAARLGTYDFVFCRNVLIYFDRATQIRAIATLERLLKMGATLFAGPAEGGALTSAGLVSAGYAQAFAFRVAAPVRLADVPVSPLMAGRAVRTAHVPPPPLPLPAGKPAVPRLPSVALSAPDSQFPPPNAVSRMRIGVSTQSPDRLAEAARLADGGQLERAAALCRTVLSEDGANAQAEYLLGLVRDAADDAAGAQTHYRRALYLDPQHYEALVHSAALLRAQGDPAGAERMLARAERAGRTSAPATHDARRGGGVR